VVGALIGAEATWVDRRVESVSAVLSLVSTALFLCSFLAQLALLCSDIFVGCREFARRGGAWLPPAACGCLLASESGC